MKKDHLTSRMPVMKYIKPGESKVVDILIDPDMWENVVIFKPGIEYTIRAVRKGMRCETSDLVFLCPNPETTGYHYNFKEQNFFRFLKKYFSIKSAGNPVYWSVFVILSAPAPWVVPNLARVWFRSIKRINKRLFYSLRYVFDRNK